VIGGYPVHPVAGFVPHDVDEEMEKLAADIKENGLVDDIVLYDEQVPDERNRLTACLMAEVEPRFVDY
jgi:hypothetical protein